MNELVREPEITPEIMEAILVDQDASKLSPAQRLAYLDWLCFKFEVDKASQPFIWIRTRDGKLKPYTTKGFSEQLRKKNGIDIELKRQAAEDGMYVVEVLAHNAAGRSEPEIGAVPYNDKMPPDAKANARMKAMTVAKRRAALAISGVGMNDEAEMDNVRGAKRVTVDPNTGEITTDGPTFVGADGQSDEERGAPYDPARDVAARIILALKEGHAMGDDAYKSAKDAYRDDYIALDEIGRARVQSVMKELER